MSEDDAAEFARGMLGPFGAISYSARPDIYHRCVIGLMDSGEFFKLGGGHTWEQAADEATKECVISADYGYGPWEVPF